MNIEFVDSKDISANAQITAHALIVMPFVDVSAARRSASLMALRADAPGTILCVYDSERHGYVRVINKAFASASCEFFGYVAQDSYAGRGWLKRGLQALERQAGSLLAFNDGKWHGEIAAFGLVRSKWVRTIYSGHLMWPEYRRHYADYELTLIAKQLSLLCYEPNAVLIECDWEKDTKSVDEFDKTTFERRLASRFAERRVVNS